MVCPGVSRDSSSHRLAHPNDVTGTEAAIDARDTITCLFVGQKLGTCCRDYRPIAASVIAMFVGVDDLSNPANRCAVRRQAFFMIQRIDSERLTCFRAHNEIVEVPI